MGARNSSRWLTATGSRPSPGPICSETVPGAGCVLPCSPWGMAHWGSGARCARCSRPLGSSAAGSTRSQAYSGRCPSPPTRPRRRPWPRSASAEDRRHALDAVRAFEAAYGAKFPKAAAKITDDLDELLAFYDYPAEHWVHLRTTNDRVDLRHRPPPHQTHPRTRLTRGRTGDGVQTHPGLPRPLARGERPHLVALVRAGATFESGKLVERPEEHPQPTAA